MADLAIDREIFIREHDLCFVCMQAYVPNETTPHMCAAMPFDAETVGLLVPDEENPRRGWLYAPPVVKRQRERDALLAWDNRAALAARLHPEPELFAPRPKTIGDLLRAGRCCVIDVAHHLGFSESWSLPDLLFKSLKERGLDWASPGGHRWVARPYGGKPAPYSEAGQIWAECTCLASGFQPKSRVVVERVSHPTATRREGT